MENFKHLLIQLALIVVSLAVFGIILMYILGNMFDRFKDSILTRPYPHVYEKPVSAVSKSAYKGGGIDEFTKYLDSVADRLSK